MKVKTSVRVWALLMSVFILLGTMPVYSENLDAPRATAHERSDGGGDDSRGSSSSGSRQSEDRGDSDSDSGGDSSQSSDDSDGNDQGSGSYSGEPQSGNDQEPGDGGESGGDETGGSESGTDGDGQAGDSGSGGSGGAEDGETEGDNANQNQNQNADARYIIVSFDDSDQFTAITADVDTAQDDLGLPASLSVTYIDEAEDDGQQEGSVEVAGWSSQPGYDPQQAGLYTFTAKLPDDWKLNVGVRLPRIVVRLNGGVDEDGEQDAEADDENDEEETKVITAFTDVPDKQEAELETPFEELPLPDSLRVNYYVEGDGDDGENNDAGGSDAGDGGEEEDGDADSQNGNGEDDSDAGAAGAEDGEADGDDETTTNRNATASTTGRSGSVPVEWSCVDFAPVIADEDYQFSGYDPELLGTFTFRAEIDGDGWALADGVELPEVEVQLVAGIVGTALGQYDIEVYTSDPTSSSSPVFTATTNNLNSAISHINTNNYSTSWIVLNNINHTSYTATATLDSDVTIIGQGYDKTTLTWEGKFTGTLTVQGLEFLRSASMPVNTDNGTLVIQGEVSFGDVGQWKVASLELDQGSTLYTA